MRDYGPNSVPRVRPLRWRPRPTTSQYTASLQTPQPSGSARVWKGPVDVSKLTPTPTIAARQWVPRDPHDALVTRIVADHLPELRERIAQEGSGRTLPSFVLRNLEAVATCGDVTKAFIRLRCDTCKEDRAVPLSCKSAICPSCAGRTMAERAAFLVDRVLDPTIGWRQIVVTPFMLS